MVHASLALIALAPIIARWLIAWEQADESFFSPSDVRDIDRAFIRVLAGQRNEGSR